MPICNRIGVATTSLLLLVPFAPSAAQTSSLVSAQNSDGSISAAAPGPMYGAAQKTFFTRHDLYATLVAAAVTGGFMAYDEKINDWWQSSHVQGSQSVHNTVHDLTRLNETPLTIASVLTYGIGRLTKSKTTADVGLHWTEALLFTDVVSQAIRGPLGRARPRLSPDDPFVFHGFKGFTDFGYRAFPSLHAAVGFATAAALVGEIRERDQTAARFWAIPLYTLAMVPGVTRMYLNQHWASDVVSGAFIGQLIGARVVRYAHTHKPTRLDRALLAMSAQGNGFGGTLLTVDVQTLFGGN